MVCEWWGDPSSELCLQLIFLLFQKSQTLYYCNIKGVKLKSWENGKWCFDNRRKKICVPIQWSSFCAKSIKEAIWGFWACNWRSIYCLWGDFAMKIYQQAFLDTLLRSETPLIALKYLAHSAYFWVVVAQKLGDWSTDRKIVSANSSISTVGSLNPQLPTSILSLL